MSLKSFVARIAQGSIRNNVFGVCVEQLESRQLLHADGLNVAINFQPSSSATPSGFIADVGKKYADRGNGFSYGWNADNTAYARQRNSPLSPGPEYDTHEDMYRSATKWQIAVPNGTYLVHVVAGDPTKSSGMDYRIAAEGIRILKGKPTSAVRFIEGTAEITVADGKLTLTNATGAISNRICFVEINEVHDHDTPVVSVSAPDSRASEINADPATFYFSRDGDLTNPLTVNYTVGGSATAGADYNALSGSITFAAGASDAQTNVVPLTDSVAEGEESVILNLQLGTGFTLGTASATAFIEDVDQPAQPKVLTWSRVADGPIGRSEASGATVNGKLYVFGGYIDSTYHPTKRSDVYDPATDHWTRIADLPVGLTHAGTAVDGQYVYLAGGYPMGSSSQTFATKTVLRYDTVSNQFTSFVPLPSSRGGGDLERVGRELHFFGGSDSSRVDRAEHWVLNLDAASPAWVSGAPLPRALNHLGGAVLDGRLYSVLGQNDQDENAVVRGDLSLFDPTANSGAGGWISRQSLSPSRSHVSHSTVVFQGKIITLGGEGPNDAKLATVSAYDPTTNTWSDLTPLPAGRKSGVAELIGDKIYFTTGGNSGFNKTTWVGQFV